MKSIDSRAIVKAPIRSKDASAAQTTLPPVRPALHTLRFCNITHALSVTRQPPLPFPLCLFVTLQAGASRPREHQRVYRQEARDVPGDRRTPPLHARMLFPLHARMLLPLHARMLFPLRAFCFSRAFCCLQVQMSLDTKRAEIRKLEEQAQQREDALKRSESMLEEDAMRFDAFLKENDYKAVEAIRKAEQETKAKQVPEPRLNPISADLSPPPPAASCRSSSPSSSGAHRRDQAHLQPNRISQERHGAVRGAA